MKAEITKYGKLAIVPESYTEDYAMQAWLADNAGDASIVVYLNSAEIEMGTFLKEDLPVAEEDAEA